MSESSSYALTSADDRIMEMGVERSQNHKATYFTFMKFNITISQFEVSSESYLEGLEQDRLPEKYTKKYLMQVAAKKSGGARANQAVRMENHVDKAPVPMSKREEEIASKKNHLKLVRR